MTLAPALKALFAPRSIALVGATERPGSVGSHLTANLLAGGFDGPLHLVNRTGGIVHGHAACAGVQTLPEDPDLAVIAVPASDVVQVVSDLAARKCTAAIVISAGFEGHDEESSALRAALMTAARSGGVRLVGPNCLGVISPPDGLNASFARGRPPAGNLAVLSQSGAVAAAALDWAPSAGVGFSRVVTLGDALDLDVAELLTYLAADEATRAILLYLEGLADGPAFLEAARAAGLSKPVIVLKGGRSAEGAKAALTHTGALAGADAVYSAAFRKVGLLQVDSLQDFLDAGAIFSRLPRHAIRHLGIVTNGGGAGILAVDAMAATGCELATLTPTTLELLDQGAPKNWSHRNPVDLLGDAAPAAYSAAMEVLLRAPEVDAVLILNCPTAVADSGEAAEAAARAVERVGPQKPVLAAWLGEESVAVGRSILQTAAIPCFRTPEAAVRAAGWLDQAARFAEQASVTHRHPAPERAARAESEIARCRTQGLTAMDPASVQALLEAYGIPSVRTHVATSAMDAAVTAQILGEPVALKILSRDISHKSDVGGVVLGLKGRAAVLAAADAMRARVTAQRPAARLDGFLVQEMVSRPKAQEVIVGMFRDPTFGPVVMIGQGGVAVEVVADRALALPPLDEASALDLIGRTRVSRLLRGFRDRPAAQLTALAQILIGVGQLALELPEVSELDLNPVLCDERGALAIDARIGLQPA